MREIRTLLADLSDQGVTVFLSSHLLHEIEQVCNRVAVLKSGRIIAEGEVKNLLGEKAVVKVRVPAPQEAARTLMSLPGAIDIQPNGAYVSVAGVSSQAVVAHLTAQGIVPSEITTGRPDLESIFLELTTDQR